jgi:signal peptidase II
LRRLRVEHLVLPAVALLTLAADQLSKRFVITNLLPGQSVILAPWLTPVFQLTYITNTGVVFGLLPGLGDFFIIVAVLVIIGLLLYHRHLPEGQWLIRTAMGLQLGGASGNLLDRLLHGSVIDFIDVSFWPLRDWPVFNLADGSIVAGAILLGAAMLWDREDQKEAAPAESEGS